MDYGLGRYETPHVRLTNKQSLIDSFHQPARPRAPQHGRYALQTARLIGRALLRAVTTGLIFLVCLVLALRYLGVPVPSLSDVLHRCESVAELADILS